MKRIIIILLSAISLLSGQTFNRYAPLMQKWQNASVLNGSTQYWQDVSPDSMYLTGYSILVMAWVYPQDVSSYQFIVGRYKSAAASRSFQLTIESSALPHFWASGDGNTTIYRQAGATVTTNSWYNFAATYSAADMNFYLNGALSNGSLSAAVPSTLFTPTSAPLSVGVNGALTFGFFNGMIGEVQIVRFASLPANVANIIASAYASKKMPTSYESGDIIFHTRWNGGGIDLSGKKNNVTPATSQIIIKKKY